MAVTESRFVTVDGMRTHYLEAGPVAGPAVVLLHSGEYGSCAEASWSETIPGLADAGYHVFAPDWLGYGKTDKVIDFADPKGRRVRHLAAAVRALGIESAAFVGNSMGGTYLAEDLAGEEPLFPAAVAVLASGGGFIPFNEARSAIQEYDLTEAGMAKLLRTATYSSRLTDDPEFVAWRHKLSLEPGAWQCAASARLRPPATGAAPAPPDHGGEHFGRKDPIAYERFRVPALVIAGAQDPLREPGYADEIAGRLPDAELHVYDECGHLPNLEHPRRFVRDVLSFLERRYRTAE
ncbi:alpha/beta fold hydrolase [Amycolatopsis sp. NPDC051903]|uniref:alpha/beta fold hydrolase n=1 Tax=Amycolatopsis sp. NPDC051903 TaxID=3363936 RepID=UPI003797828D